MCLLLMAVVTAAVVEVLSIVIDMRFGVELGSQYRPEFSTVKFFRKEFELAV